MESVIIFVTSVVGAIATGLQAIGLSEAAAWFILDTGIKLAGLSLLGNLAGKLVDIPDLTQTAAHNLVTTRGTIEHQRIIYGKALVSGPIQYMNSAGSHNQSMYHCVVVAGHECEDLTDMWLDDIEIPEAAIDWSGNGSVDSGDLRGDVTANPTTFFQKFLGVANQTAPTFLTSAFAEVGTSHNGHGIAGFVARCDFFDGQTQVWSAGAPRNYRALVSGKKVYDPRSDGSQSFGTGPHRVNSDATWEWSDNPALCWADYMIDADLGFGENSSRINYGYVASAAEICDAVVFTPVGTDRRFRCNGTLSTANRYDANLGSILSAGNMTMALVQGAWNLRGFGYETPTLQFNDDDLRNDIQIELSTEEAKRYNTVRGIFIDMDRKYQSHQFPAFTASEYVARDNGETIFKDIQLPMTNDNWMAQRLAAGLLEQSDLQRKIIYPSNFKTLPVEIGGTIGLSNTKMGWSEDTFRVTNYRLSDMQGIDLVLQEDTAAAYTDVATAEYGVSSGGNLTANNPGVPPPSSLWVEARPDGIQLFTTPTAARLYEYTKFYASPTSAWTDAEELVQVRGDSFFHKFDKPQTRYYFAASVNFAGAESDRVPNSDYTDVFGNPALLGGRFDPSFDLSDDVSDYWTATSSVWIDTTGGENGEHALGAAKIGNNNTGVSVRTKQVFPIDGDTLRLTTRYRVNSNYGTWPNSCALIFQTNGYYPTPISGQDVSKTEQTDPRSYSLLATDEVLIATNSITMDGSWYTISADVSMANLVGSGSTYVRPIMKWAVGSSGVSIDTSINARHNVFRWRWSA